MRGSFLEKYENLQLEYQRIRDHKYIGDNPHLVDATKEDYLRFFENCFHLKNWLKEDILLGDSIREKVEGFIDKSANLKIAADLANASKHKVLNKNIRVDKDIDLIESGYGMMYSPQIYGKNIVISLNRGHFDAFDVASGCMSEWRDFLNKNKVKL